MYIGLNVKYLLYFSIVIIAELSRQILENYFKQFT